MSRRITEASEDQLTVALLLLNIVVSVIISLVPDWTGSNFSTAEQTVLGFSSFIALLLVQILWTVTRISRYRYRETELWPTYDQISELLVNMRAHLHRIAKDSYGPNDHFVRTYLAELRRLDARLRQTAEKKELRVTADHFPTVTDVLGAFSVDEERVYRYTWPISSPGHLFTIPAWRHFFELSSEMVQERKITQVKVLLIVTDWALLEQSNVRALIHFYGSNKYFECKAILETDFAVVAADNDVGPKNLDFGLYGDKLLYITEEDVPPETTGIYTKDAHVIKQYRTLFDIIWASQSLTRRFAETSGRPMTLEQLFEADRLLSSGVANDASVGS